MKTQEEITIAVNHESIEGSWYVHYIPESDNVYSVQDVPFYISSVGPFDSGSEVEAWAMMHLGDSFWWTDFIPTPEAVA